MTNTLNIEVATKNIIDKIDNFEENTLVEQKEYIKIFRELHKAI